MKYSTIGFLALALVLCMGTTACDGKDKTGKGADNVKTIQAEDSFTAEPGQGTAIHFAHLTMQFGPVTSGDTVHASYPFKNATNTAVTVTGALTSCPCMKTEFPKGPIQPGEIAEIKVNFETANQMGTHEKIIAVTLQGNNEPITLHLNGKIEPKL